MKCNLPIHYRYTDSVDQEGLLLVESKLYPIRETKCFYWILDEWNYRSYMRGNKIFAKMAKRVSKNGVVRRCYPSREEALASYKARKLSQLQHARNAIDIATLAVKSLSGVKSPSELSDSNYGHCKIIGYDKFIEKYSFE